MGKGRDRRRRVRRARREHDQCVRAASPDRTAAGAALHAAAIDRALARFRSLRGQGGLRLSFMTLGSLFPARHPSELRLYVERDHPDRLADDMKPS